MNHPVSNTIEADGFVIASATDVGRVRTGNEDSHALWVSDDAAVRAAHGLLLVVCDGMGGASAGEVASQLAVKTIVEQVRASESNEPAETLREAVESANSEVHAQAAANPEQRGMGTTCTAVLLRGREVWIGHVGDSRAYLIRDGKLQKLTKDHSLVAELVEKGHLTEAEAKHDHRRNVVTRSVGALDHVQVDAERVIEKLKSGDVLVVCSDGLHGQITDAEIARIASEQPPVEACGSLIDLANDRGGPDNITAIVVRLAVAGGTAPSAPPAGRKERGRKLPPNLGLLGSAAAAMLVLVLAVGFMLFGQLKKPGSAPPAAGASEAIGEPAAAAIPAHDTAQADAQTPTPAPLDAGGASPTAAAPHGTVDAAPQQSRPVQSPAKPSPELPPASSTKPGSSAAGRPGTVRLMTRPFQPSTFMVDGEVYAQDVGFLTQSLPAGDHIVHVEGEGGAAVDVPVHVEVGGSYSLVAELPFAGALGSIEIVILGASHAQVLVDGAQYPEPAPCVVRGLTPGAHSIRVLRPKSAPSQGPSEVQVTAGGTTRAEYRFGAVR